MITYVANYKPVNRPYMCKVITTESGEEFHTALNFSNESERSEMSAELIYQHLDNCITYMEDKAKEITVIALDEPVGIEPWPAKGWIELAWANEEINLWWNYIYYKDERVPPQSLPLEFVIEGELDENEDLHTHDPVTGEHISTEPTPEETQP